MYHPLMRDKFSDVIKLNDGVIEIDRSPWAQRKLLMHVNDNVYKNVDHFSILTYDVLEKYHKNELSSEDKAVVVDKLIEVGS